MKRFVKGYANYTLQNIKDCNPLYVEYMQYKIDRVIAACQRGLITENEAIQCIGNFGHKQFYTFCGNTVINENTGAIVYTKK